MDISTQDNVKSAIRTLQKGEPRGESSQQVRSRKPRIGFTIVKDILLLKAALRQNPWQLGDNAWKVIAQELTEEYGMNVTVRTVKDRIGLLLNKMSRDDLASKNGTQQELDERKILLEEIQGLVAGSKASIINFTVPSNEDFEGTNDVVMHPKAAKKARKEVDLDNREKDEILDSLGPEPTSNWKKLEKLPEDEIAMKKLEHDMKIEEEKLKLERDRLELERQREIRITQENTRQQELAQSQLNLQNKMLEVISMLLSKSS